MKSWATGIVIPSLQFAAGSPAGRSMVNFTPRFAQITPVPDCIQPFR